MASFTLDRANLDLPNPAGGDFDQSTYQLRRLTMGAMATTTNASVLDIQGGNAAAGDAVGSMRYFDGTAWHLVVTDSAV